MIMQEIASQLNELSEKYRIGHLQDIRKEIKGHEKKAGSKIFQKVTISDDEGWACHYGGRKELQFNFGHVREGLLWYGIAFSLEPSQTLPDPSILCPKIGTLNCIIREQVEFFKKYRMWSSLNNKRTETHQVTEIPPELAVKDSFIFIGGVQDADNIDFNEILSTFDDLLDVYIQVESENGTVKQESESENDLRFEFDATTKKLPSHRKFTQEEKEISVDIRHTLLQEKLAEKLRQQFGDTNVAIEQSFFGSANRIDIAVRNNDEITFYEIKIASSAKACIRQAMGQLLEYAFWAGKKHAHKIVAIGEHVLDKGGEKYISFLRDEFKLPIEYMQFNL